MARPNNQLVRRQKAGAMVLAPMSLAAVRSLAASRGTEFVLQQAAQGVVRLSNAAYSWLTSAPAPVGRELVIGNAPASIGVAMAGVGKFKGDIRVKRRELIAAHTLSDSNIRTFRINPVDVETFPYLSGIARNYDKYKFHSVKFGIVSSAATSTAGRWYLAWDPDSDDASTNNAQTLMAMGHSLSASCWQSGELSAETQGDFHLCDPFRDDVKDHGAFWFTSVGGSSSTVDFYIEYDVTLRDPEAGGSTAVISNTNSSFITNGNFTPTGPNYVKPVNPPVSRSFELAKGYFKIDSYTIGTGLTMTNSTITGAAGSKERRANFSTTESWTTIIVANNQNPGIPCQVALGGSWSTITGHETTVTPLTIGQYNTLDSSMP